ncbi:hypothetical protein CO725_13675 [Vibrio parahaemolyticus]|nr:hypothetical protein CO725_13675 [Vibrio parahaemolyticus]
MGNKVYQFREIGIPVWGDPYKKTANSLFDIFPINDKKIVDIKKALVAKCFLEKPFNAIRISFNCFTFYIITIIIKVNTKYS